MSKNRLLRKLETATDRAAALTVSKGYPVPCNSDKTFVGNTIVVKNSSNLYNIVSLTNQLLYTDIISKDVALVMARYISFNNTPVIDKIISLEKEYTKLHLEMLFYLNSHKKARQAGDYERMYILEDRISNMEYKAKTVRNRILKYNKV